MKLLSLHLSCGVWSFQLLLLPSYVPAVSRVTLTEEATVSNGFHKKKSVSSSKQTFCNFIIGDNMLQTVDAAHYWLLSLPSLHLPSKQGQSPWVGRVTALSLLPKMLSEHYKMRFQFWRALSNLRWALWSLGPYSGNRCLGFKMWSQDSIC